MVHIQKERKQQCGQESWTVIFLWWCCFWGRIQLILGGLNFYLLVAIQVFCLGIQSEKSFGKKKPFYSTPTYKNNQHISSVQGISLFKEISSAFKKIQIKDPSRFLQSQNSFTTGYFCKWRSLQYHHIWRCETSFFEKGYESCFYDRIM